MFWHHKKESGASQHFHSEPVMKLFGWEVPICQLVWYIIRFPLQLKERPSFVLTLPTKLCSSVYTKTSNLLQY